MNTTSITYSPPLLGITFSVFNDTNRLVPSRQFGHEQAVRQSGRISSPLSMETDDSAVFAAVASSHDGNNALSSHGDFDNVDCFLTMVHLVRLSQSSTTYDITQ